MSLRSRRIDAAIYRRAMEIYGDGTARGSAPYQDALNQARSEIENDLMTGKEVIKMAKKTTPVAKPTSKPKPKPKGC